MTRFIVSRVLIFLPSVLVASILIFGLVAIIPGGAAETIAGPEGTAAQIEQIRHRLGTDLPLYQQYFNWISGVLTGQLGDSFVDGGSIADRLVRRLPVTFELAGWALLLAVLGGSAAGLSAANRKNRFLDRSVRSTSGVLLALPEFWLAILAIGLFAVRLGWVPASGWVGWEAGVRAHLRSVVLPVVILSLGPAAIIARTARAAKLEVDGQLFIKSAWSLGIAPRRVHMVLGLKNSAIPIVTVIGLIAGSLLGGAVLIEKIFNIPGIGQLLLRSALAKDVPVMQATALLVVTIVLIVNLLVDLVYAAIDPRIRESL
jgi:peptide/nickel transport system permease protein